jgi:hypothetical protein
MAHPRSQPKCWAGMSWVFGLAACRGLAGSQLQLYMAGAACASAQQRFIPVAACCWGLGPRRGYCVGSTCTRGSASNLDGVAAGAEPGPPVSAVSKNQVAAASSTACQPPRFQCKPPPFSQRASAR